MQIQVEHISFSYGKEPVLQDLSFRARSGEFWSVLGANGAGKSTFFRCMLGLLRPKEGQILIDGQNITNMKPSQLAKKLAYIPQSHSPVFHYSVYDMVLMGTTAQQGNFQAPGKAEGQKVRSALERLDISHLADRDYSTLSGGERQLVLIARALVQEAGILLMDEPSANLDFGNRIRVMETVRDLTKEGYCVIQTTHDPEQAYLYSHGILAIKKGKLLAQGSPKDIFQAELISQLYGVEVEICKIKDDAHRVCIPKGVLL
ncbi:MAG: ABC transporter ATP-binding protein [Oscillospiraceae bacterium]|nr:ABC transporter ATP-binding protein [Oscillospiraceae bacterium]